MHHDHMILELFNLFLKNVLHNYVVWCMGKCLRGLSIFPHIVTLLHFYYIEIRFNYDDSLKAAFCTFPHKLIMHCLL